jgi:hypothetical protein
MEGSFFESNLLLYIASSDMAKADMAALHATGVRVRQFPFMLDRLISGASRP